MRTEFKAHGGGAPSASAQSELTTATAPTQSRERKGICERMIGYVLAHEQFPVAELVQIGRAAAAGGFDLLATSDHFQPWRADQGHVGQAWVTLAALGN